MARKTADTTEQEAVIEFQHELAKEVYASQDRPTQAAIDLVAKTLTTYSTGSTFDLDEELVTMALFSAAVEVTKDLAILDIRLDNFNLPEAECVRCGRAA